MLTIAQATIIQNNKIDVSLRLDAYSSNGQPRVNTQDYVHRDNAPKTEKRKLQRTKEEKLRGKGGGRRGHQGSGAPSPVTDYNENNQNTISALDRRTLTVDATFKCEGYGVPHAESC